MRFDKFTINSQELIQNAQTLASQQHNQQIEPEHLLFVMLNEQESLARTLLQKLGVSTDGVVQELHMALDGLPKITGIDGENVYLSTRAKHVLDAAFAESAIMKDEYVSIEHILMAILDEKDGKSAKILSRYGVTKESFLKVLMEIRGSQRITDQNPEEKYQALDRFSRNLTDLARLGKLDPDSGISAKCGVRT